MRLWIRNFGLAVGLLLKWIITIEYKIQPQQKTLFVILPPECGGGPHSRTTPCPSRTDTEPLLCVLKFSRSEKNEKAPLVSISHWHHRTGTKQWKCTSQSFASNTFAVAQNIKALQKNKRHNAQVKTGLKQLLRPVTIDVDKPSKPETDSNLFYPVSRPGNLSATGKESPQKPNYSVSADMRRGVWNLLLIAPLVQLISL